MTGFNVCQRKCQLWSKLLLWRKCQRDSIWLAVSPKVEVDFSLRLRLLPLTPELQSARITDRGRRLLRYNLRFWAVLFRNWPLVRWVHVEGSLDDRGPLEAAYDEGVWLRPLRLHQLTFWHRQRRQQKTEIVNKQTPTAGHLAILHFLIQCNNFLVLVHFIYVIIIKQISSFSSLCQTGKKKLQ